MLTKLIAALKRRTSRFEQLAFVRGIDYRYDDVDCLSVSYPYETLHDLVETLHLLGLKLVERAANVEQCEIAIQEYPNFLQPKFTTVFETPVHVLVGLKCITVSVRSSSVGSLSLAELKAALALDARLDQLHLQKLASPISMADFTRREAENASEA
jgi:hypothetical protein